MSGRRQEADPALLGRGVQHVHGERRGGGASDGEDQGVTGKDKRPHQVCVKIAKEFTRSVTLDKPLDGRKVVDAGTGEPVPSG